MRLLVRWVPTGAGGPDLAGGAGKRLARPGDDAGAGSPMGLSEAIDHQTVILARRCPFAADCQLAHLAATPHRVRCAACHRAGRQVGLLEFGADGKLRERGAVAGMVELSTTVAGLTAARLVGSWFVFARQGQPTLYAVTLATPSDWLAVGSGLAPYALVSFR